MKTTLRSTLAALAALGTIAACDRSPTEVDGGTSTLDADRGRTGSSVTVPLKGDVSIVWNVDQSPEALAECPGTPGVAIGEAAGELAGLGAVRGSFNHCSIDLRSTLPPAPTPPTLEDLHRAGNWQLAGADGSELQGSYEFLNIPEEQGGFFLVTILGGTGRFAGATGSMEPVFERSDPPTCGDPLCLEDAVFAPVLKGEIVLPRPGR